MPNDTAGPDAGTPIYDKVARHMRRRRQVEELPVWAMLVLVAMALLCVLAVLRVIT